MTSRHVSKGKEPVTPAELNDSVTPQHYMGHDHSFTLQTIMELQKSTGQLIESVNNLRSSVDSQNSKLQKIEDGLADVKRKIYAAGIVIGIVMVVGGFFVNKIWDLFSQQIVITTKSEVKKIPITESEPDKGNQ